MALHLLPKSMFEAIDLLPDTSIPVTLFTRHSLRELVNGQGLAGYDLQLTEQGRELAYVWGQYLIQNSDRAIQHCISSPIQRCVDTAALMIEGADGTHKVKNTHTIEIVEQRLLVEPGSFVLDIQTSNVAPISVVIYDMAGRLLETRDIQADDLSTQKIGERYPAGIYNAIVTQGDETRVIRVVKR